MTPQHPVQLIGIGLREAHLHEVLRTRPDVGWMEVHSENYFTDGPHLDSLMAIRAHYPVALHGVGLSLGSAHGVCERHLARLARLADRVQPCWISEHVSWSQAPGHHLPDLMPLPYNEASLEMMCRHVLHVQAHLGTTLLLENPSSYLTYTASTLSEVAFLLALCERTGAKLLLDVNNVFVSCTNHGWDPVAYVDAIAPEWIHEIHVAGHQVHALDPTHTLRLDTHDQAVCPEVWALYAHVIRRCGPKPTLLEWDTRLPTLDVLVQEAHTALRHWPEAMHAHA